MIKRYSSPSAKFTVNLKKDGKPFPLVFGSFDPDAKRRYEHVSDPDLIRQLDNSKDNGVYFKCDGIIEHDEPVQEEPILEEPIIEEQPDSELQLPEQTLPEPKSTVKFSTVAEAKDYMNKNHGLPFHKLTSKQNILKEASILNIEIEFENK